MAAPSGRLILQCDWEQALLGHGGKAWITYSQPGHPAIHGELKALGLSSDGIPYVSASAGFSVDNITRVTCIDVTPGGLAVSADSGGSMKIWQPNNGEIRRDLSGHHGDVTTCRFFPSGLVVLSGSTDMQLKVWSAETGQCAATMIGHKGGISDTAIVAQGRNIISSSRDGTVKLWDCSTSTCLTTFSDCHSMINACSVGTLSDTVLLGTPQHVRNECEVSTEGKILLVACESGTFQGYGLDSREKVFELECHGAVNCCSKITDTTAVCGTEEGYVTIVDLRNVRVPLKEWQTHRSAIRSFASHNLSLVISTGDGSCICLNENYDLVRDFTGPDCDAVYSVASDGMYVYTACRDAAIRKYRL